MARDEDSSDFDFSPKKRNVKPIKFKIGGDDHLYVFTPPKNSVMALPMVQASSGVEGALEMTKGPFNWLGKGLSQADNDRLIARLRDDDDDLDMEDIDGIITSLQEKIGKRPTTSR